MAGGYLYGTCWLATYDEDQKRWNWEWICDPAERPQRIPPRTLLPQGLPPSSNALSETPAVPTNRQTPAALPLKVTSLHEAARSGDIEKVKYFISTGADVNETNHSGYTPLYYANNVEVAEYLVSKGADVNAKDSNGNTPLHFARSVEVAEFLVSQFYRTVCLTTRMP